MAAISANPLHLRRRSADSLSRNPLLCNRAQRLVTRRAAPSLIEIPSRLLQGFPEALLISSSIKRDTLVGNLVEAYTQKLGAALDADVILANRAVDQLLEKH